MVRLISATILVFLLLVGAAYAAPKESFAQFISDFEQKAVAAGISKSLYRKLTKDLKPDPAIKVAEGSQPEFERPIWDYLDRRITQDRINRGRAAFGRNKGVFERVGAKYGVDPYMLAAIWGVETDYGAVMSNDRYFKPVLRSLFSLVHQRRGALNSMKLN